MTFVDAKNDICYSQFQPLNEACRGVKDQKRQITPISVKIVHLVQDKKEKLKPVGKK